MADKKKDKKPGKSLGFFTQIFVALIIFGLLSGLYSVIAGRSQKVTDISISEVAQMVNKGEVKSLTVKGDTLTLVAADDSVKQSKKETEAGITETLKNYGVTAEALAKTPIEIKSQSGAGFWILNLLPIILPVLFMAFFIWFLFAQSRGGVGKDYTIFAMKEGTVEYKDKRKTRYDGHKIVRKQVSVKFK
jgi:ATP-dependent Zn protease